VRRVIVVPIEFLRTRPKPSTYPQDHRLAPIETHTWEVDKVWLKAFAEEDDSDIHLILADSAGRTMITELPGPACVNPVSPWRSDIAATRRYFAHTYPITTTWHFVHRLVDVRGLGFFDDEHGQYGVAPNGIELHPVIWMRFLASSAPPKPWCTASAAWANDGYPGDYYISIRSNQPDTRATASDATDRWSDETNSSGRVRILLYHQSPGERVTVVVGPAKCYTAI
jgi:hypothetical protein